MVNGRSILVIQVQSSETRQHSFKKCRRTFITVKFYRDVVILSSIVSKYRNTEKSNTNLQIIHQVIYTCYPNHPDKVAASLSGSIKSFDF